MIYSVYRYNTSVLTSEGIADPEVRITATKKDIFANLAHAEKLYEVSPTATPIKSIAERMQEAREAVTLGHASDSASAVRTPSPRKATAAATPAKTAPAAAASAGQSNRRDRVGLSGVVRTKEVIQITRCFINGEAVKVLGYPLGIPV